MFPLKDDIPSRSFPIITLLLILLNVFVFYLELSLGESFILQFSLIPSEINFSDVFTLTPFVTSIFLHGGFLHLLLNMWFLWVFGDNVEDAYGKFFYLSLFVFWGVVAGLTQYFIFPNVEIPSLGASGAIAGVLGSYLIFFPKAKVKSLIILIIFITYVNIRATYLLAFWFVIQLFSGVATLSPEPMGGVAYFAHIGGFVVGVATALLYKSIFRRRRHEGF